MQSSLLMLDILGYIPYRFLSSSSSYRKTVATSIVLAVKWKWMIIRSRMQKWCYSLWENSSGRSKIIVPTYSHALPCIKTLKFLPPYLLFCHNIEFLSSEIFQFSSWLGFMMIPSIVECPKFISGGHDNLGWQ